jgi:hypothetical protein
MAMNEALYTGSSVTVGATEVSLTSGTTTIQAKTDKAVVSVAIDVANMAAGDEFEIAFYEKAIAGGTARRVVLANLVGAQAEGLWYLAAWQVGVGWDFSIKKIAGTDRAFSWSVRAVT